MVLNTNLNYEEQGEGRRPIRVSSVTSGLRQADTQAGDGCKQAHKQHTTAALETALVNRVKLWKTDRTPTVKTVQTDTIGQGTNTITGAAWISQQKIQS